jgi:hypothetical protein
MQRFDRLIGIRVLVPGEGAGTTRVVASSDPTDIDEGGLPEERQVIETGEMMYLPDRREVTVTMPLGDRNGDRIASVRVTMKRFAGQTQQNAIFRAQPVVEHFKASILDYRDLFD